MSMKQHRVMFWVLFLGFVWLLFPTAIYAGDKSSPKVFGKCLKCHSEYKDMKNIIAGDFYSRSRKAKSLQIKVGNRMELVKYDQNTTIKNIPSIKALRRPVPVLIHYKKVGPDLVATRILAKPKFKVPKEQLMSTPELAKLVSQGPEKAGYTLVDARPGIRYKEGHIPTAISIPFPKMKDLAWKLPKDKSRLLIFYCGGFR